MTEVNPSIFKEKSVPKSTKKKSVIPTSKLEQMNSSAIERLKLNYGIEKNVILSKDNVLENRELIEKYVQFFTVYPDIYLDLIKPSESKFQLYYYQRIFLRACMRYKYHYCIASRGFSKSHLAILAGLLRCIFLPGTTMFVCAPGAAQGIEIAQEKINIILNTWPLLNREIKKKNESLKEINIEFHNGSNFDVLGVTSKSRGLRRNAGIIDEVRDHDPEKLHTIIIPVMNIARRTASGAFNPYEPHQAQCWISSASQKSDYNYKKFIDFVERSIIDPKEIFIEGSDYHVPVACGLMPLDYIQDIKNDTTFKEENFAQEYLSIFTGGGADSWMSTQKLSRLRKLVNPHMKPQAPDPDSYYVLSVDVARSGEAKSVICIFQVKKREGPWMKKLVNMYVIKSEGMHFQDQANSIKKLIALYNPLEVIIDGSGLGRGLLDFMIIETVDSKSGKIYPAYGSFNDDELKKAQPADAPQIINVIILNATLASEIHSICYSECTSGHVRLLIEENEAKTRLMATKAGQSMPIDKRIARLYPYEMTTRLIEEIGNLRVKATVGASHNVILERINREIQKDRFSSFEYGLYCIKQHEDKSKKKKKRHSFADFIMKN